MTMIFCIKANSNYVIIKMIKILQAHHHAFGNHLECKTHFCDKTQSRAKWFSQWFCAKFSVAENLDYDTKYYRPRSKFISWRVQQCGGTLPQHHCEIRRKEASLLFPQKFVSNTMHCISSVFQWRKCTVKALKENNQ